MNTRTIVLSAIVLLGVAGVAAFSLIGNASADEAKVVVYKSPTCGCCGDWITHMEEAGFDVEAVNMDNVQPIKAQQKVGRNLQSCHTAIVGGYVIEGHVPAEYVTRLLAERPPIKGLAVPGMPPGSPGMEMDDASRHQDYNVIAFDAAGRTSVYAEVKAGL